MQNKSHGDGPREETKSPEAPGFVPAAPEPPAHSKVFRGVLGSSCRVEQQLKKKLEHLLQKDYYK